LVFSFFWDSPPQPIVDYLQLCARDPPSFFRGRLPFFPIFECAGNPLYLFSALFPPGVVLVYTETFLLLRLPNVEKTIIFYFSLMRSDYCLDLFPPAFSIIELWRTPLFFLLLVRVLLACLSLDPPDPLLIFSLGNEVSRPGSEMSSFFFLALPSSYRPVARVEAVSFWFHPRSIKTSVSHSAPEDSFSCYAF